jgi:hypothetical protein
VKRTTITVSYGRTQSLEQYNNVRPSITLGAELETGDDPEAVRTQLLAEARAVVEEEIDRAIEASGQAARFSTEPRYRLICTVAVWAGKWSREHKVEPPAHLVIILPDAAAVRRLEPGPCWWASPYGPSDKLRLAHARRAAVAYCAEHDGYQVIDASDGDLTKIPAWVFEPVIAPAPAPASATIDEAEIEDGEDVPDEA